EIDPGHRRSSMTQQVLHQEWYRTSRRTLLVALQPGCACDVQVGPAEVAGEARQEAAGSDGARLGTADVGDIREVALQLFLVLVPQRQTPAGIEAVLATGVEGLGQFVVVA